MSDVPDVPERPVVLVTGAAHRLGREIALDLAAHGHDVAVHYRASAEAAAETVARIGALGARGVALQADLSDESACCRLVPEVLERFARLDAVVNNASTFEHDDVRSFGHAAMERHWRANTAPALLLARALHDHLETRQARGTVINLLDQKLWNPNPDFLSYTLSKAALHAATLLLAQALAPRVRVCGVAPGLTLASDLIDDARLKQLQAKSLLGQGPSGGDIAGAVRFLLQAQAITGAILVVDAGQHLQPAGRDPAFMA